MPVMQANEELADMQMMNIGTIWEQDGAEDGIPCSNY